MPRRDAMTIWFRQLAEYLRRAFSFGNRPAPNRSALAAYTLQLMGYRDVCSMKTGLRGWNDYELPLVDDSGKTVKVEDADDFFTTRLRPEQESP